MTTMREEHWVECGRVGRPWGVKGEVLVEWMSGDCPVDEGDGRVFTERGGEYQPLVVRTSRPHGGRHVVHIEGISTRDQAAALRGAALFLPAHELPKLPEAEYYFYEILGLTVVTTTGEVLGTITDIQSTGANDVYEITRGEGRDKQTLYIPAADHVIRGIDLKKREMTIEAMKGLLD